MKRFKGFFLFLVIMLLSLGIASTTYARDRNGSGGWENYSSRGYRSRRDRDSDSGWGGPKLNYDGKTSGLGRNLGRLGGGSLGGALGGYLGGKAGDSWERRANRGAFDKWNRNGSRGRSWRL